MRAKGDEFEKILLEFIAIEKEAQKSSLESKEEELMVRVLLVWM